MSNYPNMSYCMCQNTALSLDQVLTAMQDEGTEFMRELSREERQAFQSLFNLCEAFIETAQELQQEYEEEERVYSDEDA